MSKIEHTGFDFKERDHRWVMIKWTRLRGSSIYNLYFTGGFKEDVKYIGLIVVIGWSGKV